MGCRESQRGIDRIADRPHEKRKSKEKRQTAAALVFVSSIKDGRTDERREKAGGTVCCCTTAQTSKRTPGVLAALTNFAPQFVVADGHATCSSVFVQPRNPSLPRNLANSGESQQAAQDTSTRRTREELYMGPDCFSCTNCTWVRMFRACCGLCVWGFVYLHRALPSCAFSILCAGADGSTEYVAM